MLVGLVNVVCKLLDGKNFYNGEGFEDFFVVMYVVEIWFFSLY